MQRLPFAVAFALVAFLSTAEASLQLRTDGGVISGRVLGADGMPVTGLRIGALSAASTPNLLSDAAIMSLAQTDREGRYRLENVPAGKYYIVADRLDSPIYYPGVVDPAAATVLTMTSGAELKDQNFRLSAPRWVKVSGRVIRDRNRAGTTVVLTNSSGTLHAEITPDGSFEFPLVRAGTYQARIERAADLTPVTVIVSDKDISNLELNIPLSAVTRMPVTFNVTLEGGGLVPRFALRLNPSGPQAVSVQAGAFANIPPNGLTVSLLGPTSQPLVPLAEYRIAPPASGSSALPAGYVLKSITAGSLDLLTEPLKISAMDAPVITIVLGVSSPPPWVTVRGRVTGIGTTTETVTSISILPNVQTTAMTAAVNADGSFEIPMILPGSYQARLTPGADPFPRTLVVSAANPASIEIPLKIPSFRVEGTATSPPLRPTQFLRATLRPELGGTMNSSSVATNGSFAFPAVQAGLYVLSIAICESDVCASSGGLPLAVDKDLAGVVVSTESNPVTRTLPAATVPNAEPVEGVVVMEGGAPLPSFRLRFTLGVATRTTAVGEKSFTVFLPPGAYQVTIADLPAGYEVRSIIDGEGGDLRARPFTVAPSPSLGGVLAFSPARRLTITLGVKP